MLISEMMKIVIVDFTNMRQTPSKLYLYKASYLTPYR